MSSLDDLYQEIILEHSRVPQNFGALRPRTHHSDGRNPLCGDEISVSMVIAAGRIEAARFQGQGCAISKASASMMTRALTGLNVTEAEALAHRFLDSMRPESASLCMEDIGELAALVGVKRFPARIKCATLAWRAFLAALEDQRQATSETAEGSILE